MNIERVRAVLGVWAPMAVGLFIIATAINFYFTASLGNPFFVGDLESWRLVCSAGAFFVGGVLILSTYGRYTKTKEARRELPATAPSIAMPAASNDQNSDRDQDDHGEDSEPDER